MDVPQSYGEDIFFFVFTETGVLRVPRLPTDLIICAMEFLPQADLRRAASVSREFYEAAHTAGLEIHRTISLASADRDVATFTDIVNHVSRKATRADLALSIRCMFDEESSDRVKSVMMSVLQAVQKSSPLLTRLDVALPTHFCGDFYDAISIPTPRLRTFVFMLKRASPLDLDPDVLPSPSALFGGLAPRLANVTLHADAASLNGEPIPAFACASHVALNFHRPPLTEKLVLSASFPAVRSLVLNVEFILGDPDSEPRTLVDLSGLSLRQLFIHDRAIPSSSLEHVARPLTVSTIDYISDDIEYHEPLWPTGRPELNAHIRRRGDSEKLRGLVAIISANAPTQLQGWTHTIHSPRYGAMDLKPLMRLSPLQTQLVSLTLDECLLPQLVSTSHTLGALRELFVDFSAAPARHWHPRSQIMPEMWLQPHVDPLAPTVHMFTSRPSRPRVPGLEHMPPFSFTIELPGLRRFTAFARTGKAKARRTVTIEKLTRIGVALGQQKVRRQEDRAELVLACSVQLENPKAGIPFLRETFRAVRELKSMDAGGDVPAYCDYRTDDPMSRH